MDGGHIVAARKLLLHPSLSSSQEGAWLLARSFDPNYHDLISSPDMTADKEQAKLWYQRWREISARNGTAIDEVRWRHIIDSMP